MLQCGIQRCIVCLSVVKRKTRGAEREEKNPQEFRVNLINDNSNIITLYIHTKYVCKNKLKVKFCGPSINFPVNMYDNCFTQCISKIIENGYLLNNDFTDV